MAASGAIFFFLSGDGDAPAEDAVPESTEESAGEEDSEDEEEEIKEDEPKGEDSDEKPAEGNEPPKEGEAKDKDKEKDEEEEDDFDFGKTYQMKTFNLNLGNALENRFVKLEVSIEYNGEKTKREIEARLPQLRDAVISVVSRKTREFLLAPDGKDALRKEILIRINRYMTHKVESVYITDILIE